MGQFFDRFGALTSAICILHCIGLPLLLSVLPILAIENWGHNIGFHFLLLGLMLFFAGFALFTQFKKHKSWLPAFFLLSGIFVVCFGNVLKMHDHDDQNDNIIHKKHHQSVKALVDKQEGLGSIEFGGLSTFMLVAGGGLLIYGHYLNQKKVCCPSGDST